jgi:hypothetical protein
MNRELVRVKGREGWTSIHFASHMEDVELLAKFLFVCPESIENVTVRSETGLHIGIKNSKYKALHLLVCFLYFNCNFCVDLCQYCAARDVAC